MALIISFGSKAVAQEEVPPNSARSQEIPNYVARGVVGTILGLGTGHIVQRRWTSTGWIATAGQILGISLVAYEVRKHNYRGSLIDYVGSDLVGTAGLLGYLTLTGFRVFEIVDVWRKPGLKTQGNFNSFGQKPVVVVPMVGKKYGGLSLMASF